MKALMSHLQEIHESLWHHRLLFFKKEFGCWECIFFSVMKKHVLFNHALNALHQVLVRISLLDYSVYALCGFSWLQFYTDYKYFFIDDICINYYYVYICICIHIYVCVKDKKCWRHWILLTIFLAVEEAMRLLCVKASIIIVLALIILQAVMSNKIGNSCYWNCFL